MRIRSPRFEGPLPLIQRGSIVTKLQAALGLKGKTAAPQLGDIVHPVVITEDLSRGESWDAGVSTDKPAGGSVLFTPTVGTWAEITLNNPAGSNIVGLVRQIRMTGSVNSTFWVSAVPVPGAVTPGPPAQFIDSRLGFAPPVLFLGNDSNAFAPAYSPALAHFAVGSTIMAIYECQIVLAPGSSIRVGNSNTNTVVGIGFDWVEHAQSA